MHRLYLLVFLVPLVASVPVDQDAGISQRSRIVDGLLRHGKNRADRNSVLKIYRWPNGVIPYYFSPNMEEQKSKILEVMDYISDATCIKFREMIPGDLTYLLINRTYDYCDAYPGTIPGTQILGFKIFVPDCMDKSVLLYLFTKAIGFYDEHQRPDRDDYVNIHWENIDDDQRAQESFFKMPYNEVDIFNSFDFDSIMMYDEYAGSKDREGGLKTITAKKPGVTIRGFLGKTEYNDSDIYRIKQMYCPS